MVRDYKRRKLEQDIAQWKLTSFGLSTLNEPSIVNADENLIGNGGSGKVDHRLAASNSAGETLAVKTIRNRTNTDANMKRP